jgi:hypothetical protein
MDYIGGFEYKIQVLSGDVWENTWTNQFDSDDWYPTLKGARNALAQMKATRYGRVNTNQYRMVRRPYGEIEVVE